MPLPPAPKIMAKVMEVYQPEAILLQCGEGKQGGYGRPGWQQ